jgi:hypothetical protein
LKGCTVTMLKRLPKGGVVDVGMMVYVFNGETNTTVPSLCRDEDSPPAPPGFNEPDRLVREGTNDY